MSEEKIVSKPIVDLSTLNKDQREAFNELRNFIYDKQSFRSGTVPLPD